MSYRQFMVEQRTSNWTEAFAVPSQENEPCRPEKPAAAATDGPGSELWQLDRLQVLEKHVQGFQFSYWVPFIITSPETDKVTVSVQPYSTCQ